MCSSAYTCKGGCEPNVNWVEVISAGSHNAGSPNERSPNAASPNGIAKRGIAKRGIAKGEIATCDRKPLIMFITSIGACEAEQHMRWAAGIVCDFLGF